MSYAAQQPRAKRYRPLPVKRAFDPTGRVDVMVSRFLMRGLEMLEQRHCLPGLADELRPGVEGLVSELLPARPLFRTRRRLC